MLTFQQGTEFINKGRDKTERKLASNTAIRKTDENTLAIRFYQTDIILIHRNGNYTLNSGGYRTVTTKCRMWEYAPANRLFQKKGVWRFGSLEFTDNMVIDSTGNVLKGGKARNERKRQQLQARIKKYIRGYAQDAIDNGGLKQPSFGCCIPCQMASQHGDDHPATHVLDHVREGYYVPSLLVTAIKYGRGGNKHLNGAPVHVGVVWSIIDQQVQAGNGKMLRRELRNYFRKIMPQLTGMTPTVAA